MVDYRDRFLFLMLETFFPPENVRNFYNRPEPGVFLWWKAEQFNQENRKGKKYYGYAIFFYQPYFFLFGGRPNTLYHSPNWRPTKGR
jgi:hypothetical protein